MWNGPRPPGRGPGRAGGSALISDMAATVEETKPIHLTAGRVGASRLARMSAGFRDFARRRRTAIAIVGSLATAALLAFVLAGHRQEFAAALSSGTAGWVLAVTVLLQVVALLMRSEAWHVCIQAAGGTVNRRVLYRASSIAGTRRGHQRTVGGGRANCGAAPLLPDREPAGANPHRRRVSDSRRGGDACCIGVVHVGRAARPPLVGTDLGLAVVGAASAGLRHLAVRKGRELWRGLAVLRSLRGGGRVVGLVLVAVFAQIFRNWLLLHAVGVDASFFDAIAVLIAVATLAQLPVGPECRRGGRGPHPG